MFREKEKWKHFGSIENNRKNGIVFELDGRLTEIEVVVFFFFCII